MPCPSPINKKFNKTKKRKFDPPGDPPSAYAQKKKQWKMGVSIPLPADCEPTALPSELIPRTYTVEVATTKTDHAQVVIWWYSVVVSISGCDPLDPGSNPGTAITFFLFFFFV